MYYLRISSKALELDFFLHGDTGAVSGWAARAGVGDAFEISATHPRSGFAVDAALSDYLLLGDETALPAIGAILEALPAHARAAVFVEIADACEQQVFRTAASVDITWVWRAAGDANVSGNLVQAALSFEGAAESGVAWIAGESAAVKAIREHALSSWRVDRGRLHAAGYWKQGTGDHRDEDAAG